MQQQRREKEGGNGVNVAEHRHRLRGELIYIPEVQRVRKAAVYDADNEHKDAAGLAALFYIGITAGRFVSGFAADRLGDRKMIRLGTGVLFCGIAALALPIHSHTAAIAAFVVMGLGCAPIYPCIIHSTPVNFGAESSGAIIGIQMAGAYVGSTFAPPLFGLLGSALGFSILPAYLLVFAVFMIAMTELTFRTAEKNRSDTGP